MQSTAAMWFLHHCSSHCLFLSTLNFPIYWHLILCKYLFPSLSAKTSGCAFIPPFKQLLCIMSLHIPRTASLLCTWQPGIRALLRLKKTSICYVSKLSISILYKATFKCEQKSKGNVYLNFKSWGTSSPTTFSALSRWPQLLFGVTGVHSPAGSGTKLVCEKAVRSHPEPAAEGCALIVEMQQHNTKGTQSC